MAEVFGDCCAAFCAVCCKFVPEIGSSKVHVTFQVSAVPSLCNNGVFSVSCRICWLKKHKLLISSLAKCCTGGASGQRGCCGCKKSFDGDDFFDQEAAHDRQFGEVNFAPQDHSSGDAPMQYMPQNGASYVEAQPRASRSMDVGRASMPQTRPSMTGQRSSP